MACSPSRALGRYEICEDIVGLEEMQDDCVMVVSKSRPHLEDCDCRLLCRGRTATPGRRPLGGCVVALQVFVAAATIAALAVVGVMDLRGGFAQVAGTAGKAAALRRPTNATTDDGPAEPGSPQAAALRRPTNTTTGKGRAEPGRPQAAALGRPTNTTTDDGPAEPGSPQAAASERPTSATADRGLVRTASAQEVEEHSMDRRDFVWTAYRHMDCANEGDVEDMGAWNITAVKQRCEEIMCTGFSLRGHHAWLKRTPRPLRKVDLVVMGNDDSVVMFTFAPPAEIAWESFQHWDWPDHGDAETLMRTDPAYLKRYAETKGYAGFSIYKGIAYMKARDFPLQKEDLHYMGDQAPVVFYIPRPERPVDKAGKYYRHELGWRTDCAGDGADCRQSQCCNDPSAFCFQKSKVWATCKASCTVEDGWSCKVLSSRTTPGESIFCFTILGRQGTEMELIRHQITEKVGITQCDEYMVLAPDSVEIANGVWTTPLANVSTVGTSRQWEQNASAFAAAWTSLLDHYMYRVHDWITFVDPHTVLFPNQLRAALRQKAESFEAWDNGFGIYLRACASTGSTSESSSALQILSQLSLAKLNFHMSKCRDPAHADQSGTEWLQNCLDDMGAVGASMPGLLVDGHCKDNRYDIYIAAEKCDFSKVAYHPVASAEVFRRCSDHAEAIHFL